MKKRILALLLAGILTASMTSCFNRGNDPDDTSGSNTEDILTRAPSDSSNTTQAPDTWTEVADTVYTTTDNLTLRTDVNSNEGTVKVNKLVELKRTAYNKKWSRVEYNGSVYYVSNSYITSEDIYGKTLTPCANTVMYVITDGLNVRTLASSNSTISPSVGSLKLNETVTVIAKGENWCRISYKGEEDSQATERYVSTKYLASQPYENPDTKDYSSYFTSMEPTTMYVTASAINLRKAPSVNASIMGGLEKDDEVIVVAYAKSIPETVDGKETVASWYKVKVTVAPDKEGDPPTIAYYYATAKYISDKPGNTTLTLADMLEQYPTFSANAKTLYVCSNAANTRSTPSLKNSDNITKTLQKKDQVKVVATGVYEDNNWCMIELEEGVFAFIGSSTLTTDPNGEPAPLSLEDLLIKYPQYEKVETTVTLTAKSTVNCYTTPGSAESVPLKLNAGDTVTLVAVSSTNDTSWCVVQAANGNCYFAGYSLFEVAAP